MSNIIYVTFYRSLSQDKMFTKIMLPMLKLYTNYDFHELFLKKSSLYTFFVIPF